jgi:hypothetical protein
VSTDSEQRETDPEMKDAGEAAIDAVIAEGYQRIPQPVRDPWAEASARRSIADEPW